MCVIDLEHRSMGNDLQKESELSDDSQQQAGRSGANSDERPSAVTQPAPFSSCVDPAPRFQHEIEDPGSIAEATNVTVSKPNDESVESIHQTNECLDQSSSQPQLSQAMPVNESLTTTPPTEPGRCWNCRTSERSWDVIIRSVCQSQ